MLLLIYHGAGDDPVGTAGLSTPVTSVPRKKLPQDKRSVDDDTIALVTVLYHSLAENKTTLTAGLP